MSEPQVPSRFGPFLITGVLGRGAMGAVFRARDENANRDVALKLNLSAEGNETRRKRFAREGEVTASLAHPGIIGVHSAGDEDGRLWIAYELIEGARSLADVLSTASLDQRLEWVVQTAEAVGHAHSKGILHRDLKSENVLVDSEDRARVADFGLAACRSLDRLTVSGALLGTPYFMSPEQLAGETTATLTPATDVWSLGVLLYEALTERMPFDGDTLLELATAAARGDPSRPTDHNPDVSPSLEAVCLRALRRRPADRYASGLEFAADLDRARNQEELDPATIRKRGVSRSAIALAGLCVAIVCLVTATVLLARRDPGRGAPDPSVSEGPAPIEAMKDDALVALREAIAEDQFRKALKLATDASLQPILRGEGSSEVRRELLGKGTQVATSGSTRSLEQILRIAQLLAPVDDSSGTEFADAVLDRVCKLEDDSQEALGNPLVLSLVQDLTQTGLRPHPTKLLLVFDRLAVFERTPSPLFRERLYGLLLERVRNDQTLHISHLNDLNWETWRDRPELTATSDARETFLWLALECDVKAPERRKLAGEKMLELAAGEGSELGPVSRGRAMLFASQTWRGTPPKDVHLGLVSACKISPADPDLCRETAEAYMKLARDHAGKGSAMRDNLLRAFWFAAVGVNAIESLEYDRVASLAKSCFKVRRLLVVLCSALGNDAAAQKVIDSVAERPTGNTPHQLNTLETARREGSAEWRKRLDGEPQVGAKPTQKWTEVNEAVLRGHHRKRLKGLSKPERLEVVEANVLAARGANWDTVRPHIRRALKLSSNASAVRLEHLRLASAYAQYAAAESVHEGLLSVQDPSVQLEVRLLHAELLWFRSRLGDALREFSALAADDTAGVVGRIAEAESAWLRGEYLAARNAASKVVAIDRFNLSARLIKSMALLSARQRAPARAYFKLAFERVGVGDPRSRGVRTALRVLDGSKSLGPQRLVIHDGAKRALAAGPGDFDRRLAIQLALGSGTGFARRWAASTARTLSTDKSVSTSHSLLLVGFVNLVRNDSKSAAELWREALRQDPGLAIPRPYLERFAKRTSQAEADSFR